MLLIGVSLSCSDDNEPEEIIEEKKPLVDKVDSVFIDNGEYIAVNTVFTDEEALAILDSTAWVRNEYEYIYDTYNIKQYYQTGKFNPSYKVFGKDGYYSMSLKTNYGIGKYTVKNKELIMTITTYQIDGSIASQDKFTSTIVGIDSAHLVLDTPFIYVEGWTTPDFKTFSSKDAKSRSVYKRYNGDFVSEFPEDVYTGPEE